MPRPIAHDQHVACPDCKLMDYYVTWNEATRISRVVCQHCSRPFINLQWVPETLPEPAVVI